MTLGELHSPAGGDDSTQPIQYIQQKMIREKDTMRYFHSGSY